MNLHQMQDENDLENVLSIISTVPNMAAQQKESRAVFGRYKRGRKKDVISHWDTTQFCVFVTSKS